MIMICEFNDLLFVTCFFKMDFAFTLQLSKSDLAKTIPAGIVAMALYIIMCKYSKHVYKVAI